MDPLSIIAYISAVMKLVDVGTTAWNKLKEGRDLVEKARAEGRDPTPDEWATLTADIERLEDSIGRST